MRYSVISNIVKNLPPRPEERALARVSNDGNRHGRASNHPSRRPQSGLLRTRSASVCLLAALLALPFSIGAAHAHAFLDHADPRVGNTVKSPRIVSLWFTQNLENAFSSIEVLDANGMRMNAGNALVDSRDRKLLRVPVRVLPPGTYTVKWHVLSVDTHTTDGHFTFNVGG